VTAKEHVDPHPLGNGDVNDGANVKSPGDNKESLPKLMRQLRAAVADAIGNAISRFSRAKVWTALGTITAVVALIL